MENIARLTASPRSGALPALAQHTTLPRRHAFSTVADFALPLTPRAVKVVLVVESIRSVIHAVYRRSVSVKTRRDDRLRLAKSRDLE
jgi:hypothetical protein